MNLLSSVWLNVDTPGHIKLSGLTSNLNLRSERWSAVNPEVISLHFWMMKLNSVLSLRLRVLEI